MYLPILLWPNHFDREGIPAAMSSSPIKAIKNSLFLYRAFSLPNMHMPVLSSENNSSSKHRKWTNKLRALLDFPCHRGVKLCLAAVFCLALLFMILYLNIVAVLIWDSMRRNSLERALPLRHSRNSWHNSNETAQIEAKSQRMRQVNVLWFCLNIVQTGTECQCCPTSGRNSCP